MEKVLKHVYTTPYNVEVKTDVEDFLYSKNGQTKKLIIDVSTVDVLEIVGFYRELENYLKNDMDDCYFLT